MYYIIFEYGTLMIRTINREVKIMTRQTYKYISISVALLTSIATITFIYFLREKNKIKILVMF